MNASSGSTLVSAALRALPLGLLLLLPVLPFGQAAPLPVETEEKRDERLAKYADRNAYCTNGTVVKLKVLDDKLTLKTAYGKLVIPLNKVTEIEFATRLAPAVEKKIDEAIKALGDDDAKKRDAAAAALGKLKLKAYPALLKLENSDNAEVKKHIGKLLEALRKEFKEEELQVRKHDVVHTEDSYIAGEIEATTFLVNTDQFGESKLNIVFLRKLGDGKKEEDVSGPALPDPGYLTTYQGQIGKTFTFTVTGAVKGTVWGTDKYTLDSNLATAAMHAGVVKAGQTKNVTVRILPAQAAFVGTVRNGVSSNNYTNYPGAYEFVKKRK
jgi:hypothetical protein